MIVRQIASGERPEQLQSVAIKLAQSGEQQALSIVLTQIASTDENFISFVTMLCETLTIERLVFIGSWLIENGMISAIHRQIAFWNERGSTDKANCWEKLIVD